MSKRLKRGAGVASLLAVDRRSRADPEEHCLHKNFDYEPRKFSGRARATRASLHHSFHLASLCSLSISAAEKKERRDVSFVASAASNAWNKAEQSNASEPMNGG